MTDSELLELRTVAALCEKVRQGLVPIRPRAVRADEVGPGETMAIHVELPEAGRLSDFLTAPIIAEFFDVLSLDAEGEKIVLRSNAAVDFVPQELDTSSSLGLRRSDKGARITVRVRNKTGATHPFFAAVMYVSDEHVDVAELHKYLGDRSAAA